MSDLDLLCSSDSDNVLTSKDMSSGFRTKTRTSVNCFPHGDPLALARKHPARASVQRS